jgi:hypothetical protein
MCEYTAVLLGILLLKRLRIPKGFSYILLGDSMSSLAWALKETTNSGLAHNAHIGLTLAAVSMDALIASAHWLSSKDNYIADGLSRGVSGPDLNLPEELHYPIIQGDNIDQYVKLCDPSKSFDTANETIALSRQLLRLLKE